MFHINRILFSKPETNNFLRIISFECLQEQYVGFFNAKSKMRRRSSSIRSIIFSYQRTYVWLLYSSEWSYWVHLCIKKGSKKKKGYFQKKNMTQPQLLRYICACYFMSFWCHWKKEWRNKKYFREAPAIPSDPSWKENM